MSKKPKAPKYKKDPKAPKAGASIGTLENYKKRCDDVAKENQKRRSDYEKALKAYDAEKERKKKLRADGKKVLAKAKGK